jgi:hypothetical protein
MGQSRRIGGTLKSLVRLQSLNFVRCMIDKGVTRPSPEGTPPNTPMRVEPRGSRTGTQDMVAALGYFGYKSTYQLGSKAMTLQIWTMRTHQNPSFIGVAYTCDLTLSSFASRFLASFEPSNVPSHRRPGSPQGLSQR